MTWHPTAMLWHQWNIGRILYVAPWSFQSVPLEAYKCIALYENGTLNTRNMLCRRIDYNVTKDIKLKTAVHCRPADLHRDVFTGSITEILALSEFTCHFMLSTRN